MENTELMTAFAAALIERGFITNGVNWKKERVMYIEVREEEKSFFLEGRYFPSKESETSYKFFSQVFKKSGLFTEVRNVHAFLGFFIQGVEEAAANGELDLYDEQYPQNKDAVVDRSAEDIAEDAPHDGNILFPSNEHGFFIKKDYILSSSIGTSSPLGEAAQSLLDDHKKNQESLYVQAVGRAKRRVDIEEEVAKTQMSSLGYTPHSRAADGSVITYTSFEYKADVRVYKTADGSLNANVYNVLDRSIIKTSIDSISFPHPRLVDFIKQLDKLSDLWDDQ